MDDILLAALTNLQLPRSNKSILKGFVDKNDEGKIKTAIEFLMICSIAPNIYQRKKNSLMADKKINELNSMINCNKLFKQSLKNYTQAAAFAPTNSEALASAYASRSIFLYNSGFHHDSLKDIQRVLNLGCSNDKKSKLFVCQVKNLLAIDHTMRPEVEEAIESAKNFLNKASDADQNELQNNLDLFATGDDNSFHKPDEKWDDMTFLPETPDGNLNILRASDGITIKYSKIFGRHILATRDIKAGEAIIVHKAYAATLYENNLYTYCWHCSRRVWSGVPCTKCVNAVFCNEECREQAWIEYHDIECRAITALGPGNINPIDVMATRITIKAYKEAGSLQKLKEKVAMIDGITDQVTKAFTDGIFDDTKYTSVCTLMKKPADPMIQFQYALRSACLLYYLAATTDMLQNSISSFKSLIEDQDALFLGALTLRHYEICITNATGIETNDDSQNVKKGGQLMSFLSLFNHSCDPNAYQYTSGDINAIIAVEAIKKDSQIFINDGPGYMDMPTDMRRKSLQEVHKFWCKCTACTNNWYPGVHIQSFTKLSLPQKIKKELSTIKEQNLIYATPLKFDMLQDKSANGIHKVITKLFELLNIYGEHVDVPCHEVQVLKISLIKIYNALSR